MRDSLLRRVNPADLEIERRHAHDGEKADREPPGMIRELVVDHLVSCRVELEMFLDERVVQRDFVMASRDLADDPLVGEQCRNPLAIEVYVHLSLLDIALERAGNDQGRQVRFTCRTIG